MSALVLALCSPLGMVNAVSSEADVSADWRRVRRGAAERRGARAGETEEDGYEDEYTLEDLDVAPGDYIRAAPVPNFRASWEALGEAAELADDYGLGERENLQARPPATCRAHWGVHARLGHAVSWKHVPGRARARARVRPAGRCSLPRRAASAVSTTCAQLDLHALRRQ